jgi:hypothetical protein
MLHFMAQGIQLRGIWERMTAYVTPRAERRGEMRLCFAQRSIATYASSSGTQMPLGFLIKGSSLISRGAQEEMPASGDLNCHKYANFLAIPA